MKLSDKNQILNLANTNGRRNDLINAYTIYMKILSDSFENGDYKWDRFPNSLGQFHFYERALQESKEVFKKHGPYDYICEKLQSPEYNEPFNSMNKDKILELEDGKKFINKLDNGVEDRSRHYTSTLTKIGFIYENRQLSSVGKIFINDLDPVRNSFEKLLPIDKANILLLRQGLKIRVYTHDYRKYYSPIALLIYILFKIKKVYAKDLFTLLNTITPYFPCDSEKISEAFSKGQVNELLQKYEKSFISEPLVEGRRLQEDEFYKIFSNNKTSKDQNIYFDFYNKLFDFVLNPEDSTYLLLKKLFENNYKKKVLNNTFGQTKKFLDFNVKGYKEFIELNSDSNILSPTSFNNNFYIKFFNSKRNKDIHDYKDMLKRFARATGIIEINNGIVNLAYRDVWVEYLKYIDFNKLIFNIDEEKSAIEYEESIDSPFYKDINMNEIFDVTDEQMYTAIEAIKKKLNIDSVERIKEKLINHNDILFKEFINSEFPLDKTINILSMFSDRNNDKEIKKIVGSEAGIPTIYEYIVGIAWYHISNKDYDVFSSFNLTMNANFLPETHAGGGAGDIVVKYDDSTLMLEVTLMNKNAQKRGEWEPVLRHATNLTIDEQPKKVRTLFIADELDENTINIWRAVASVPMKSTTGNNKYADNITIMPFTTSELISLMNNNIDEKRIFEFIDLSYNPLQTHFDLNWRNKILEKYQ
ncbi:TPA: AlwI family type II restriction endonuclease [Staphylococcus aureus]|uniref:AlwI family type II restriction endonuclease n=1 Tax=Staphylococcus pettenkoferi TaxID=170573 RepID=UPI0011A892C8|nr:AlwI family type II restriction endonuclease [Staphylococcus pettenkoferi]